MKGKVLVLWGVAWHRLHLIYYRTKELVDEGVPGAVVLHKGCQGGNRGILICNWLQEILASDWLNANGTLK